MLLLYKVLYEVYWKTFPFYEAQTPPWEHLYNSVSAPSTWYLNHGALHGQWTYNGEFTSFKPTLFISVGLSLHVLGNKTTQKKNSTASLVFNANLTWENFFLSHSMLMFFSINLVMEVKYWVMFFHICLQSQLGTGQGRGNLAHNMESLSKESNINVRRGLLSQNILITITVC